MAKSSAEKTGNPGDTPKLSRVSQSDVPAYPLSEALRVAHAIADNYASAPTKPLEVAAAMNMAPSSSNFRSITGSAIAYGLTDGGYNAVEISLTPLSVRILTPLEVNDDLIAKREALLRPRVIGEFLKKYDGSPLPPEAIARNVLQSIGVPKNRAESTYKLIVEGAESLGLLQEIKSKKYVNISRPFSAQATVAPEEVVNGKDVSNGTLPSIDTHEIGSNRDVKLDLLESSSNSLRENKKVFVTHGNNKGFVDPIKKLLAFGELEPVVSVERQSVSQPVPDKVLSDMRECGAAIIHVEGETTLLDKEANEHVVLNPNVLIEIGAAMALYEKRFILLVKDGVKLPSNLQGLYEVRYEGDALDGNATIRLLEAINQLKAYRRA